MELLDVMAAKSAKLKALITEVAQINGVQPLMKSTVTI